MLDFKLPLKTKRRMQPFLITTDCLGAANQGLVTLGVPSWLNNNKAFEGHQSFPAVVFERVFCWMTLKSGQLEASSYPASPEVLTVQLCIDSSVPLQVCTDIGCAAKSI
jgi:hypothetical protein